MASSPRDWWPISESNPVPGEPDALAALGRHMKDAATEIQRIAGKLPNLAASDIWDSDAGEKFRTKSKSVATDLSKAQARFQAVAAALGTSSYGGSGYAAELQECQDHAYAAAAAVVGSDGAQGSEAQRLRTWNQLLAANDGQSPLVPPPAGGNKPGQVNPAAAVSGGAVYPQASPGSIPSDLPLFSADTAEVRSLKGTYNDQLAILRSSAATVSNAASSISSAAQRAATMIHQVIDHDGLNNPHWWQSAWHSVASFVSAHWVGFVKTVSMFAGIIATACGIIAMVLAFIPGLQPFAAVFEAVSVLAMLVSTVCDLVLAVTGNGSWANAIFDLIGLVTFGIGSGLIGRVGEAAETVGKMEDAFEGAESLTHSEQVSSIFAQADAAMDALKGADRAPFISLAIRQMKNSSDFKSLAEVAVKALTDPDDAQIAKMAELKSLGFRGALSTGLRAAVRFDDPEIAENLEQMTKDADSMTTTRVFSAATIGDDGSLGAYSQVVTVSVPAARVIVESSGVLRNVFRGVQAAGVASDLAGLVFG